MVPGSGSVYKVVKEIRNFRVDQELQMYSNHTKIFEMKPNSVKMYDHSNFVPERTLKKVDS
jgi:hypothetical protein